VRRVVVTGLGAISALGHDVPATWAALEEGRSGIAPITLVDTSTLRFHNGAEVRGFSPEQHFPASQIDALDRFAQLALVAAREAVRDAGMQFGPEEGARTAVLLGSSLGGQTSEDKAFHDVYAEKRNRLHPLTIPRIISAWSSASPAPQ
jgi:nodulation protein E